MNSRFEVLIFDWDGTLVNSIDWIVQCVQKAALHCDCRIPKVEETKSIIGLGLDEALTTLFPDACDQTKQQLILEYRTCYFSKKLTRDDFFFGVDELLHSLNNARYSLAIATGKSRSGLDRALRETGTEHLFTASRCADETASKPDPTMLFELMEELDCKPETTLMVGDSVHDLKMAASAGISSVGVACGANRYDQLVRFDPLFCLDQTSELESFLLSGDTT